MSGLSNKALEIPTQLTALSFRELWPFYTAVTAESAALWVGSSHLSLSLTQFPFLLQPLFHMTFLHEDPTIPSIAS